MRKRGERMYKILIIEDDCGIALGIEKSLQSWGFKTKCVTDFSNVLVDFSQYKPHLILLDISLPFFDGYHWCSEIRKVSKVPIVFISSASDNMNIVMAMNMGADDFIAKPFDKSVLVAKVQAMIRRTYNFSPSVNVIEHRGAMLNVADGSVNYNNKKIFLTKNEYTILHLLMENKNKIISRDTLMEHLWQTDSFVDENTLTVNISRLRKKLDSVGLTDFITTKVKMGYIVSD